MKTIILFFFLFTLVSCNYKELSKYSSVSVIPDTYVYLDITSFKTNQVISIEITMDLFFASQTSYYKFQIDQVEATSYTDYNCWKNLRTVTNKNVTTDGWHDYTFTWSEIKQEGKNFLFIIPPAPFSDYYDFWGYKIKINNTGGLSTSAIIGIVVGAIALIAIIGLIIYCCRRKTTYGTVISTNTQPIVVPMITQPVYQAPASIEPPNPVYQQPPNYQQPIYQEPQNYQQPLYQQPPNYQQPQIYQQYS